MMRSMGGPRCSEEHSHPYDEALPIRKDPDAPNHGRRVPVSHPLRLEFGKVARRLHVSHIPLPVPPARGRVTPSPPDRSRTPTSPVAVVYQAPE